MNLDRSNNSYWWSINWINKGLRCSDSLLQICGLNPSTVTLSDLILLIHPDHKNTIQEHIATLPTHSKKEQTYQLLTKFGYRWVKSKLDHIDGCETALFYLEFLREEDVKSLQESPTLLLYANELISRYTSISDSLLELLHVADRSEVISKILNNLLEDFKGDRAYIFTYDLEHQTQSCTYEVVRDTVCSAKDDLQNIPLSDTLWWTEMLYHRASSIIYDNIDSMPIEARGEYQLLKEQHIESIMVVPLITKQGTGGYIGIDMVGHQHIWNDTDCQWFESLANIISLCIELSKSEEAAQTERAHYSQLYENMPIGFLRLQVIRDSQGTPINYIHQEINSLAGRLIGVAGADIDSCLGETLRIGGVSEPLLLFDRLIRTRGVHTVSAVQNKDFYLDYTLYSVEADDVVVLIRDNTASVTASRALRKSEQTLQNIYKNIPIGIEIYDKDGVLLSINDMEQEIFGFESKESVLGVNLFDNPNVPTSFLDDLRNEKPSWCDFFYDFGKLNTYYSSSYHGRKHIVLKGVVLYDIDHNVENYLLIVLDNTDFLKANHKIREFETLFNSIAEFSEVGLCQWNRDENTIFGTDQWYKNLSQENRTISNIMEAYSLAHEQDKANLERHFQDITSGVITGFREEVRIKDGEDYRWLNTLYKVSEHTSGSDSFEIIGINIDITALKHTEYMLTQEKLRAEESDRLKSAFLANMSHEIRTPLNAIVGFSNLLVDTTDQQDRLQYMSIIRQNNDLLLQLISDILDISKIESGIIDIKTEMVNIDDVCTEVVCSQRMKVADDRIHIQFETAGGGCKLETDRNRLIQILSNIVGNAIKFTPDGTISVGYSTDHREIKFYIRDTGLGISAEHLPIIFTRFIKLNNFINGTGLGLPICKSLIEKMGGEIWVESQVGVGSCFYFTLPYRLEGNIALEPIVPISPTEQQTHKQNGESEILILVAEDTDSNYLLISSILKREYRLLRAINGIEAIELFRLHRPSLILMDVKMPEMDGLEATRRIKDIDPHIPIIMLTAFAFDDDKTRAFEVGCCDFLTKPIQPSLLKDTIKKYISG